MRSQIDSVFKVILICYPERSTVLVKSHGKSERPRNGRMDLEAVVIKTKMMICNYETARLVQSRNGAS